jgi:hypothetical protein
MDDDKDPNYDWYSEPFPPAKYPRREAFTMSLAAIILAAIGWWLFVEAWRAL